MNMKLTNHQISTLKNVNNGAWLQSKRQTLDILEKKGLIKLHVPIGWKLTKLGIDELNKVK